MFILVPMPPLIMKSCFIHLLTLVAGLFIICSCNKSENLVLSTEDIKIVEVDIPMSDGTLLRTDLYLPTELSDDKKLPILLEYLPYRKDEGRSHRYSLYSYFIKNGYIVARVDIRGTGRSEGRLVDGEYSDQEQLDGLTVIDWLSKYKNCDGNIAMFGISWGGFNALQIAMRHPPALKTIISLMSTDDIYQDDVHFMDGIMHVDAYEIGQDLANILSGAPDFKIDDTYFKNRFDTAPWFLKYKRQQHDGPFWNRASLNEDYSKIDIPIFIIGGWYDGYRDFIKRIMENADVPVKAILGPWNHTWPNWAAPGPAIEWRQTAVNWLDHWTKNKDNGIMLAPSFIYYQRSYHGPGNELTEIPGSWRESTEWPATRDSVLFFQENHRLINQATDFKHNLTYKASSGIEASGSVMWWGDWAVDQQNADIHALIYDSDIIMDSIEILGFPSVSIYTSTSSPRANWVVRLIDVAPDGKATLITGAGYNANHHQSDEYYTPLTVDSIYKTEIELHLTSWTFLKGHRIRVSLSNAQWPMFWPSPFTMTASVYGNNMHPSILKLPIPIVQNNILKKPFGLPVTDPILEEYENIAAGTLSGFAEVSETTYDSLTQTTTVTARNKGEDHYPWGIMKYTESITHKVTDLSPAYASVKSEYNTSLLKNNQELTWTSLFDFRSDSTYFYYDYTRILKDAKSIIREKHWNEKIARE